MFTSQYALEKISKSSVQERIDWAAQENMARTAQGGKPAGGSRVAGTVAGLVVFLAAAVTLAKAF